MLFLLLMIMATHRFTFLLTFLFVIVTTHAELDADDSIQFGYSGDKGPDKWGSLSPKFSACTNGKAQSPINIAKDKASHNDKLKDLNRDYKSGHAKLVNNGFNVALHFDESPGTMSVDGKNYSLHEMHWHTPSEHKLDGQSLDAELQLIHKADDGSITISAILYQVGNADSFLAKIQGKLAELAKEKCGSNEIAQIDVGNLDTKQLRKSTRTYFRYTGSFTTPPCTEKIVWHVFGKVRPISKQQIDALKAPLADAYKNNARPVQSDNGRQVEMFDVHKNDENKKKQ